MIKNYILFILFFASIFHYGYSQKFIGEFNEITNLTSTADGTVYFTASTNSYGSELWKTDESSTTPVLVKDINKSGSSNPNKLFVHKGLLYFQADDGINGAELWVSDGTEEGTFMVKDIQDYSLTGSYPSHFIKFKNEVYFLASSTYSNRPEIYKTDGTEAGTTMVYKAESGSITSLTVVGDKLYFVNDLRKLYETNGTAAGTKLIEIDDNHLVSRLYAYNGDLYFTTYKNYNKLINIYKLDSKGDLELLHYTERSTYGDLEMSGFTGAGEQVYFTIEITTDSGEFTNELWVTNGTMAGTNAITSFTWEDNYSHSLISGITAFKDEFYFIAPGSINNYYSPPTIWKTDGSLDGTIYVMDFMPNDSSDYILLNNIVYFSLGNKLWTLDLVEKNTEMFSDIEMSSRPEYFLFKKTNNLVFFKAQLGIKQGLYSTALSPVMSVKKSFLVLDNNETLAYESKIDSVIKTVLKIENIGNKELAFSKVELTGDGFYLDDKNERNINNENPEGRFLQVLKPKEKIEFDVNFFPTHSDFSNSSLLINSNDLRQPEFKINFSGYASENKGTPQSIPLIKDINFSDVESVIKLDNNTVDENSSPGTLVGFLTVKENPSKFIFELVNGNGDTENSFFKIEDNQLKVSKDIDYELKNTCLIRVKAQNEEGEEIEENLVINIEDIYEPPVVAPCIDKVANLFHAFLDVEFIDDLNVLAVGTNESIIKSYDGGKTWKTISEGELYSYNHLQFTSETTGYIMGDKTLLKTEDAGENWYPVELPKTEYPYLSNMSFPTSKIGYVYGGGKFLKTTDGGKNWRQKNLSYDGFNIGNFLNEKTGFLVNGTTLYKTTNGGEDWQTTYINIEELPYNTKIGHILFIDENTGFLAANKNLLKTIDGGDTWEILSTSFKSTISSITFQDQYVGYVTATRIYKTEDGGKTWIEEDKPNSNSYSFQDLSISKNGEYISAVGITGSGYTSSLSGHIDYKSKNDKSWQNISYIYSSQYLNSLYMKGLKGYMFGDYQSVTTDDGGATWQPITSPEETIFQVKIINDTIYLLGRNNIYISKDNAESWEILAKSEYYEKLFFIDDSTVFAINTEMGISKSTDGGQTWRNVYNSLFGTYGIYFKNSMEGFAASLTGLYQTIDGGEEWMKVELHEENEDNYLYSVCFFDDNLGIAGGDKGVFYRTTDGGKNWKLHKGNIGKMRQLYVVDENTWYCISESTIYRSTDAGLSWKLNYTNDNQINDLVYDNNVLYGLGNYRSFFKIKAPIPAYPGQVKGNTSVEPNSSEIYSITENGANYKWEVNGNNILKDENDKAIIKWGDPGQYTVNIVPYTDCGVGSQKTFYVNVVEPPVPTVIGNIEVSEYSKESYSTVKHPESRYDWFVEGAEDFTADQNKLFVNWGEGGIGSIEVIETSTGRSSRKSMSLTVTINSNLDVAPQEKRSLFNLYPNPTNEVLNFSLSNEINVDYIELQLLNITGQVIKKKKINLRKDIHLINLENLPSGIYVVKLLAKDKSFTKKIIKI